MTDRGPTGVLVVDDHAPVRELVRLVLEGAGYAVREAADGAEALRRVRETRPGVILLDLAMPGLDGPGFVVAYRAQGSSASAKWRELQGSIR